MLVANNLHGEHVVALVQEARYVEAPTAEGAGNSAEVIAVEPHVGLPVDSVEVEISAFSLSPRLPLEDIAVPEV